ncbi:uncharacterized protein cp110 isoform X1 [Nerophis lumbriciformis]|uniref:uncharacterized protein cp110 isoform X1 n=1 Tax=Nerophis lumbriciformis TaxID=546530 RepID=UPI003BA954BB
MEDYDTFVLNRFSQLKRKDEEHKTPFASYICFHGKPILPPVLTVKQREKMQHHRKDAVNHKLKDKQRMAYVQTILHSVQLRNSPTLDQLLQELKVDAKSLCSTNSSQSSLQSADTVQEKTSPNTSLASGWLSPKPTNSSLFSCHVIPQNSNHGGWPVEQQASQLSSIDSVNCFSAPSGCHDNMKHARDVSDTLDSLNVSHDSVGRNNTDYVFLHNTSDSIARRPDIISYPPIDGEELERSGQESSFCHDFIESIDSSNSIFPEGTVTSDHLPEDKCANSLQDSAISPDHFSNTTLFFVDESETMMSLQSSSSKASQPPCIDLYPSTEQLIQCEPKTQSANKQEPKEQSQSPHRPSLQDLLKKSQEYRRQQRMLRNQAKNARIQERAQDEPRLEEQSLSDKENDEFRYKSAEGRKPKERRCLFNKTVNSTCKKSSEKTCQEELICKNLNGYSERVPEQNPFPQQHLLSIETCQSPDVYQRTSDETSKALLISVEGQGNYHSIPLPNFCQSPVHSKASIRDGVDNMRGKPLLSTSLHESHTSGEGSNLGHQGDGPSVLAKNSQDINKLESCLCSLKELISDLGCSIMEIEGKWKDSSHVDHVGEPGQKHNLLLSRQSLDSCRDMLENCNVGAKCIHSGAQCMHTPDVSTNAVSNPIFCQKVSMLSDTNSYLTGGKSELSEEGDSSSHLLSPNQSYDVNAPQSGMWNLQSSGSDQVSSEELDKGNQLTPEKLVGTESSIMQENMDRSFAPSSSEDLSPCCRTPTAASPWRHSHEVELGKVHTAQVRALQEKHRRQQEEVFQALAAHYHLPQRSSFPCSTSGGDTLPLSQRICQPSSEHLERWRLLLLAAVKGYLTRRLLRTERVTQLVRTVGDTQQFLQAFQQQIAKGDMCSKEDRLLQQRVSLQLRVARYELYYIFFSLSVAERMQLISLDRELVRDRVFRRQTGHTGISSLSAATQKSLERKRGLLIQKKVSERNRGVVTTNKTTFSEGQPPGHKRGQLRKKLLRIS